MNIVNQLVNARNLDADDGLPFVSETLRVGNDGKAMFTACPFEGEVSFNVRMQVNIAAPGPDGPFEDQWAYMPYGFADHEDVYWPTSGYHSGLIPGVFVRLVIDSVNVGPLDGPASLRLSLRTAALSGAH